MPVKFAGVGEGIDDLKPFDARVSLCEGIIRLADQDLLTRGRLCPEDPDFGTPEICMTGHHDAGDDDRR